MSTPASLSILIPVYNFGVEGLVETLAAQCRALALVFEIRAYDDGSDPAFKAANAGLRDVEGVVYRELDRNIGRSRIRNLLAREAAYETLLFLDCDGAIPSADFIGNYLAHADSPVVVGGTIYAPEQPAEPRYRLHWKVGKAREERKAAQRATGPYRSITLNNILVHKGAFLRVPLDETIRSYGHEDTKFGQQLKEEGIAILHIDNPVAHQGLSTNLEFLGKTKEAQRNLHRLYASGCYGTQTGVVRTFRQLQRLGLTPVFTGGYRLVQPVIERALTAGTAPLFYFDLYKLYHFIRNEQAGA
ncbi:MAG: glycosyltransferase [Flavobacteriales bacterium]|nr:glycosyltransferase [Flavobacteriales bacterium]